jgi:hypothetical protein
VTNPRLVVDADVERHAATGLTAGEGKALGEEARLARAGTVRRSHHAAGE